MVAWAWVHTESSQVPEMVVVPQSKPKVFVIPQSKPKVVVVAQLKPIQVSNFPGAMDKRYIPCPYFFSFWSTARTCHRLTEAAC